MSQRNDYGSIWGRWRACGWAVGALGCLFAAASFAAWAPDSLLRKMPGEDSGWQHAAFQIGDYVEAPFASTDEARSLALDTVINHRDSSSFLPAALDAASHRQQEIKCLALNIYHEARGESEAGRHAVAHVVMNRVADPDFPSTACAVVREGGTVDPTKCQFTWWCDEHGNLPRNVAAWRDSQAIAERIYDSAMRSDADDVTGGALWYHADYVSPDWRFAFARGPKIGRHLFYRKADSAVGTEVSQVSRQVELSRGMPPEPPLHTAAGEPENAPAETVDVLENGPLPAAPVKREHHVFPSAPSEATAVTVVRAGG